MNTGRVIAGGLVARLVINIGETLLKTLALFPTISSYLRGFSAGGVTTFVLASGFVEAIAGTVAGAYFYREKASVGRAVSVQGVAA